MLYDFRRRAAARLLEWGRQLHQRAGAAALRREQHGLLIFFHGYSLAHTIRPIVIARALRDRGYHVVLAGRGPHTDRVRQAGFSVRDVETLPQERMDAFVARGEYAYYDLDWIDRCVRSERALLQEVRPEFVLHDMKPTATLSARLEGVDDARVTQAYHQPGYPEPIALMDRFGKEAGPFAQYLAKYAREVKRTRSLFLMADIPEFHPPGRGAPGYYYVGPLLDQPAEKGSVPLLDEGWDLSRPLIYLSCGSSGRAPDYLDEVVAAVAAKDWRVLITTAGRWTPSGKMPDHVRAVEFIPGEWVLRRAQVLVGVIGIGAIYQALRQGVPIVGAPEHIDQEYHLNRVERLGVGIKLERRAFAGAQIVAAVESVLENGDAYRARCAPFAAYMEKWQGGEAVADLMDRHFRDRDQVYRVEGDFLVGEEEFVNYLDSTLPAHLQEDEIRRMLRNGLERGLPHLRRGEHLYFDYLDSWNWLYEREPHFFETDYRALEEKRRSFFVLEGGRLRSRCEWQHYQAHYRYRLRAEKLAPGQKIRIFLPYPVRRPGQQEDVELLSCAPEAMETCFAPGMGFFYGFEHTLEGEPFQDFEYTCRVRVREQVAGRQGGEALTARQRRRYLELEPGLLEQPEVLRFRQELGLEKIEGDEGRARAIYEALGRSRRFRKTRDRAQGLLYSTVAVLREEGGHCTTLARAFISLCRAEGIAAREVCGALIGYPEGENRYAVRSTRETLFGHTWAEVFVQGRGWVPVEFHGIVVGEQALSGANVRDAGLEALIRDNTEPYLDYYFGRLDNQRLLCSTSVKRIPICLVEQPEFARGTSERWQWSEAVRYECSLEVECL